MQLCLRAKAEQNHEYDFLRKQAKCNALPRLGAAPALSSRKAGHRPAPHYPPKSLPLLALVEIAAGKCYFLAMTKRFEEAVAEVRKLPAEQQDRVADLLIELTGKEEAPALTPEQVAGVHLALEQVERGEFASDENVERLLYRPWK